MKFSSVGSFLFFDCFGCLICLLGILKQVVSKDIKRFQKLGHIDDRTRKSAEFYCEHCWKIINGVKRNSRISIRKVSSDININRETVRNTAKINLGLKPYKQHAGQLLSNKTKNMLI